MLGWLTLPLDLMLALSDLISRIAAALSDFFPQTPHWQPRHTE